MNGLGYLLICALIVIVVLVWDNRKYLRDWEHDDD
jgi:uncharacterized membrane protein